MKIIFLGPPGSGKKTQAERIEKKYNIKNISHNAIFENTILDSTTLETSSTENYDCNYIIQHPIIIHLIEKTLKQHNCFQKFILYGFPKNVLQAQEMRNKNIIIDYIIELKLPDKIFYERNLTNTIKNNNNKHNNIKYNTNNDKINHLLLINKKLLEYKKTKHIVMNFYKKKIINKMIKYYQINANNTIEAIYKKIKKIIIKNK